MNDVKENTQYTVDEAVDFLEQHFFSRTDIVAAKPPWDGQACPAEPWEGATLRDLLFGHVTTDRGAPLIAYRTKKGYIQKSFFARIGSYCPNADSTTAWACIDIDGQGHSFALESPDQVAAQVVRAFRASGVCAYPERSKSGKGWHIWVFFGEPVPFADARDFGLAHVPHDAKGENGDFASAENNKGIEVFPKSPVRGDGVGFPVWLPFWRNAEPGGCRFYALREDSSFELIGLPRIEKVPRERVDKVVAEFRVRRPARQTPKTHAPAAGFPPCPRPVPLAAPKTLEEATLQDWRRGALERLPLEQVYGPWLTGQHRPGWFECRDPASPTGDRNPSAAVADGSGHVERGYFTSFRDNRGRSVFDFIVERGWAPNFPQAMRLVAKWAGVPLPRKPGGGFGARPRR